MNAAWIVFAKEWVDAWRDRRTLLTVLLSSVAIGPLVLVLLSMLVSSIESREQSREVLVRGIDAAPTLRVYLERQGLAMRAAPADAESQIVAQRLEDAVLVVPPGFEATLAAGEVPVLEVVGSSASPRSQAAMLRLQRLGQGFAQEQALLRLAMRGVAPGALEAVQVDERDLADAAARAAEWSAIVPFFLLMAVVYGTLGAALDTTAGERERGSLEPLLLNPVPASALVLGKWAAVAGVGMAVALLGCLSFLPGQWLLRNETLAAMFRFGWREALVFAALLVPLAALMAAALMAVAIRCRSFKEAQASATVLLLAVSLLPLVSMFGSAGDARWQLAVPGLAQVVLMKRVLAGQALAGADFAWPFAVGVAGTVLALAWVTRALKTVALR